MADNDILINVTNPDSQRDGVVLGLTHRADKGFLFPIYPKISVDGNNELAERSVNSDELNPVVIEQWSRGNYSIVVEGWLMSDESRGLEYGLLGDWKVRTVHDYVSELTDLLTAKKALYLFSAETERLGIQQVAVKSWSWPTTNNSEHNQRFSIRLVSLYAMTDLIVNADVQSAYQAPPVDGVLA